MELIIAAAQDLDYVADLVNKAYRGIAEPDWTTEKVYTNGPRTNASSLNGMIKSGAIILLAPDCDSGGLSGCVALSPAKSGEWGISMLAVSPQAQSAGLGRAIMAGAEKFARDAGARSVKISVINVRVKLIAWYERLGFAKTGEREPFSFGDSEIGGSRHDELELVMLTKSL
ncbi:GNAT family N-acetyltransferase [Acerihabitans sp. KWT182]|uniref:GNAT family N-acetyltransferase n=1 Tax=Acerihabitans sp. KWT182 TaxID=3157919 RepID=A0AAU7Q9P8_9GAMM